MYHRVTPIWHPNCRWERKTSMFPLLDTNLFNYHFLKKTSCDTNLTSELQMRKKKFHVSTTWYKSLQSLFLKKTFSQFLWIQYSMNLPKGPKYPSRSLFAQPTKDELILNVNVMYRLTFISFELLWSQRQKKNTLKNVRAILCKISGSNDRRKNQFNAYCTRAIITLPWLETGLNYKPVIFGPEMREFPHLVHKFL